MPDDDDSDSEAEPDSDDDNEEEELLRVSLALAPVVAGRVASDDGSLLAESVPSDRSCCSQNINTIVGKNAVCVTFAHILSRVRCMAAAGTTTTIFSQVVILTLTIYYR